MLTPLDDKTAVWRAARRLADGKLVAFPTETVYGLGADAENPAAVARIYAAKQRPTGHPLIVHLAPDADLSYWMGDVSPYATALVEAFWPGPLTLIVPRASHIPAAVSGGQPTIGLRCPSHPVAQALLTRFASLKPGGHGGVAAPSANKFGSVSPTRADHVRSEFPELDEDELLILDGGPSQVGIESTIIDISDLRAGNAPVILRPGHILPKQIAEVLGVTPGRAHGGSPQVSGTLKAHYAPRTPLTLCRSEELSRTVKSLLQRPAARVAALVFQYPANSDAASRIGFADSELLVPASATQVYEDVESAVGPVDYYLCNPDPQAYAQALYGVLRALDRRGYSTLVFEQPPETSAWRAVNDRLGRAAAAFQGQ